MVPPARARRLALGALVALLVPSSVAASGFARFEQGARAMGFAGAFTAQASDPSAIFYNAAGIAFLKGRQASVGGSLITSRTTFTGADPRPGAGIFEETDTPALTLPAVYYTHQFTERLVFGAGLHAPFRQRVRWALPDAFSGRFISLGSDIKSYSINPTAAYKLADRFAVGAGLDIRLSEVTLERRVAALHPVSGALVDAAALRIDGGRETEIGFNLGVLARPTESLSVGAQYRHRVREAFGADASFSILPTGVPALDAAIADVIPAPSIAAATAIGFPAVISGGAAYVWGDWTFAGDLDLVRWSTFQQIAIDYFERADLREVVVADYADTVQVRLGAERRLGPDWAVRGGYSFEPSPAPVESISPLFPEADRHGIAVGGSWLRGPWRVDAATGLVFSPARQTQGASRDSYDGTYESSGTVFALSVGYAF